MQRRVGLCQQVAGTARAHGGQWERGVTCGLFYDEERVPRQRSSSVRKSLRKQEQSIQNVPPVINRGGEDYLNTKQRVRAHDGVHNSDYQWLVGYP